MLLSQLIKGENAALYGKDVEIDEIYSHSKKKVKNGLFFCLNGRRLKGDDFVEEAEKFGAAAIVSEAPVKTSLPLVVVPNVRAAYSAFAANFYKNPEKELKITGVVGTNGKTSVTYVLRAILTKAGKKVGVIGTEGSKLGDNDYGGNLTTPDPEDLFRVLREMADDGATHVAMEVSAHAIYYEKVCPITFETLVFTNCTEDHLDFFSDLREYSAVKKSIFLTGKSKNYVINTDDETGLEIANALYGRGAVGVYTYGIYKPSDVFAAMIREEKTGTKFVVNYFDELLDVDTKLLGVFNVYNQLAAITCAKLLGAESDDVVSALSSIKPVAGRMEFVSSFNGADIFVDYAHTPDGLEKSLIFLRKVTSGNLVLVFGCGGDRDAKKRPLMGKTAGDIADFVVLTSDNPRYEDPLAIIRETETGLREATLDYITIVDRRAAIEYAVKELKAGDALLIAGKGAETYQEIMGVKHDFDDKKVVSEIIDNNA